MFGPKKMSGPKKCLVPKKFFGQKKFFFFKLFDFLFTPSLSLCTKFQTSSTIPSWKIWVGFLLLLHCESKVKL